MLNEPFERCDFIGLFKRAGPLLVYLDFLA